MIFRSLFTSFALLLVMFMSGCGSEEPSTTTVDETPASKPSEDQAAVENSSSEPAVSNVVSTPQTSSDPVGNSFSTDEVERMKAEAFGAQSSQNIKHILLALHNYYGIHGYFPPAVVMGPDGKPWHSWRVLLLPYLEQTALYDEYRLTEPWNSEHNLKISKKVVPVYNDPIHEQPDSAYSHYAAALGADTSMNTVTFDGTEAGFKEAITKAVSIPEITDGTSNTAVIGTISPEEKIVWTEPRDVNVDMNDISIGLPGNFYAPHMKSKNNSDRVAIIGYADGSSRKLSPDTPVDDLKARFTKSGGE